MVPVVRWKKQGSMMQQAHPCYIDGLDLKSLDTKAFLFNLGPKALDIGLSISY